MQWVQGGDIRSDKESFPVLFPVVDSLNHRPLTKITWEPSSDSMALITDADLPANVECFNNYGAKGNEERMCPLPRLRSQVTDLHSVDGLRLLPPRQPH